MNERLSFRAFVKQKAKGQVADGTLPLYDRDRQVKPFETAMGWPAKDPADADELPGYG